MADLNGPMHKTALPTAMLMSAIMLQTDQSRITLVKKDTKRMITCAFASKQQIFFVTKANQLMQLELTLQAGRQLSVKALEDASEIDSTVPIFHKRSPTTYEAHSRSGPLADRPVMFANLAKLHPLGKMIGALLAHLSRQELVFDGQKNLYSEISALLVQTEVPEVVAV